MEKITIKEIIEFSKKGSDKTKRNFAKKLKTRIAKVVDKKEKDGGNYWIISNSSIYKTFKNGKDAFYDDKIAEVFEKINNTNVPNHIVMYERNLSVLHSFKEFEILNFRPKNIKQFITIDKSQKVIELLNLPIYINPNLVFLFEENGVETIGGLLLVPQLNGFSKTELGVFCEVLYILLKTLFSDKYVISEEFCIAIDTFNVSKISYSDIERSSGKTLLKTILLEINRL